MSVPTLYWCKNCSTSFSTSRYLTKHQANTKSCLKYREVFFCCERCGTFKTKGIRNIEIHLEKCTGEFTHSIKCETELEKLKAELEIEKTRSTVYASILGSLYNINPENILENKKNDLYLFNITPETKIYLQDKLPEGMLQTQTNKVETYKHSTKKYRRITKLEGALEPTKQDVSQVINLIDKKSKESLRQLDSVKAEGITRICNDYIAQLKNSRVYTKILKNLRLQRSKLLGTLQLDEYIAVVKSHTAHVEKIFKDKQQTAKKAKNNTLISLTPMEARLLRYQGYTDTQMDADCRERLKSLLKYGGDFPKEFEPFDLQKFTQKLTNYSVAVFPIDRLVRWALINPYGFWNVVYLPLPKSGPKDPYSFYVLRTTKKGKRYWNMDCRLEDFTTDLITSIQPYLISTFRNLYYSIFNDNNYRNNYMNLSTFASEDCEQLAHNIILLSQTRKFGKRLRTLLVTECMYKNTNNDSFSLTGDDSLQRKRFQEREKVEVVSTVRQLFDEITDEQAVEFYKCRNIV